MVSHKLYMDEGIAHEAYRICSLQKLSGERDPGSTEEVF